MKVSRELKLACGAIILLAGGIRVLQYTANNLWSLEVLKGISANRVNLSGVPAAPAAHPSAGIWKGVDELRRGETDGAIQSFQEAIHQDPDNQVPAILLGRAYAASGDYVAAGDIWHKTELWEELKRALELSAYEDRPEDALMFATYLDDHYPQEMVSKKAYILISIKRYEDADAILGEALGSWPKSKFKNEWADLLGDTNTLLKRWSEAVKAYQKLTQEPLPNEETACRGLAKLGNAMFHNGQGIEPSTEIIKQAIANCPNLADGYWKLGDVYADSKLFNEAELLYIKAIEIEPENSYLMTKRIDLLMNSGRWKEAAELVTSSLQKFPDPAYLYYQAILIERHLGNMDQAIAHSEYSIRFDTGNNAFFRILLAQLYEEAGRDVDSIQAYRAALEIDPTNPEALEKINQAR